MAERNRSGGVPDFIDSILTAFGSMDMGTLAPTNHLVFHPLFAKQWCNRIAHVITAVEQQRIPLEAVAAAIHGPSHIRAQLPFLLLDLKAARVPKAERERQVSFFYTLLAYMAKGDINGWESNIGHTTQEIQILLQKPFRTATPQIARQLGKLYSTAYHLLNGLYTDFYTDYGAENLGPYVLPNNRILVIKHLRDLRPEELWAGVSTPCRNITLYAIYENVQFRCDAISVHTTYEGDPITGLAQYFVEVDGEPLNDLSALTALTHQLEPLAVKQWQRLVGQDHETLKAQGIRQRCHVFKNLFRLAGINWEPDAEMLAAVQDKSFATTFWNPPQENEREYWAKVMNPAEEFYG